MLSVRVEQELNAVYRSDISPILSFRKRDYTELHVFRRRLLVVFRTRRVDGNLKIFDSSLLFKFTIRFINLDRWISIIRGIRESDTNTRLKSDDRNGGDRLRCLPRRHSNPGILWGRGD